MILIPDLFPSLLLLALPVWLYAEIHYRFKGVPSRLFMREPEIIADVPHRLEPGNSLPILLIIKDARRFPIRLRRVTADIIDEAKRQQHVVLLDEPQAINDYYWWRIKNVLLPGMSDRVQVNVIFEYETPRGKLKRAMNDNYRGVSHSPLQTYIAAEPLPALPGYISGDLHCHTDGTDDQVEFGAPLEATTEMARAMGLQFFAATDHSYDIDDLPENYLQNDPQLQKWREQRRKIAEWNAQRNGVIILPGEEVSCANRRGRNVHFLVLGHSRFLPGSGDGAERWFNTRAELSVEKILEQLDDDAAAFAAHPSVRTPPLEWLLLRRGRWHREDFELPRLDGLQIWNGHPDGAAEGLQAWREMLLAGSRLVLAAGNDAHGNFSRFRQVGFPFLRMREHRLNIFGRARTVVSAHPNDDSHQLIASLRQGNSCSSTGPVVSLQAINRSNEIFGMGEIAHGEITALRVTALSSREFGEIENLKIWFGDSSKRRERLLFEKKDFHGATAFAETLPVAQTLSKHAYFRAELETKADELKLPDVRLRPRALSNPVWVE